MISEKCSEKRTFVFRLRHNRIAGFSDADWAGCPIGMRSTIGIVFLLKGILCCERVKSKMSLDQVRSKNTGLRLILYVSLYGYKIF